MWHLSRRAILKGIAGAGALAATPRLLAGCADDPVGAAPSSPRPTQLRTLEFDLSGLRPDATHRLEVGSRSFVLQPYDAATRARVAERGGLSAIPDLERTHFVADVPFPADALQSFTVSYGIEGTSMRGLSLAGLHVPLSATRAAEQLKGSPLRVLGYRRPGLRPLAADEIQDLADFTDTLDAARWLAFHHPEILTLDPVSAALVLDHLDSSPSLGLLARTIGRLGVALRPDDDPDDDGWARGVPTRDPVTGKQSTTVGEDGVRRGDWHYAIHPDVVRDLEPVISEALASVRDDDLLEDRSYHSTAARTTRSEPLPDAGSPDLNAAEAPNANGSGYQWTPLAEQWDAGQLVHDVTGDADRNVSVTVSNCFNRHVGVFFAFADSNGKLLTRAEAGAEPSGSTYSFLDTEYLQCADMVGPPPWFMGIPVPGIDEARVRVTAKIPAAARRLHVVVGALGFDKGDYVPEYERARLFGSVLTIAIEYGFPTIALAYGALTTTPAWASLVKELAKVVAKTLVFKVAPALAAGYRSGSFDWTGTGVYVANETLKIVITAGGTTAALWAGSVAAGQAMKAIPIVGMALWAVQTLDTFHAMMRTSLELGESKQSAVTVITSTNPVRITATPKDKTGFAKTGVSWRLFVTPEGGNTLASSGPFDPIATPATFDATLAGVPSGGTARYRLEILSCSGWPAAVAEGSFTNVVSGGAEALASAVLENVPVPIDDTTRYSPRARLDVTPNRGAHAWITDTNTPEVGAVIACPGGIEKICDPAAIAVDVDRAQLAYSWQSAQKAIPLCDGAADMAGTATWSLQNVNLDVTLDDASPDATLKVLGCGLTARVLPVYGLRGPRPFALEASSGVYHLRELSLDRAGSSDYRKGPSWGSFTSTNIRAAALHKSGVVMTASDDADKLEILRLVRRGSDHDAPRASLRSGAGRRSGRVRGVVAIAAACDGDAFLVLENGNKRIQALGLTGARIDDYFDVPGAGPSPFLELPPNREYRDVGVEIASGTIYVLSVGNGGSSPDDFELSIYGRGRGLIATTRRFVASRMALDANQNVYALGFEALRFRERREPGVWLWIPSTPGGGDACP